MPFILLILFSAFSLEIIGTVISVIGLSSIFTGSELIIIMAIALDVGKVVSVSFLYKYWKKVNLLMKTYMTIAAIVLMGITSAGAFGYLSAQFQKAIANTNESGVMITALTDEQSRLQKRKEEIDAQISKLPDNMVAGRKALMKQFAPEVDRINTRLADIDTKLPELKIATLHQNVEVGPIIYIAEAFGTTPEKAVKWVIFIIIFVFDPLAIALLLSGNFLLEKREEDKEVPKLNSEEFVPHSEPNAPDIKVDEDTSSVVPHNEAILPKDISPFFNGEMSSPVVNSYLPTGTPPAFTTPYYFQSPTQAVTSWTTTTVTEEPIKEEPKEELAEPLPEIIPPPHIDELTIEEIEELLKETEVIATDSIDRQIDEVAILGADHPELTVPVVEEIPVDHPDAIVEELEQIEEQIIEAVKAHDEREIIRLDSLVTKQPVKQTLHRSVLEDYPSGLDVMIDENQRRASTMHRSKYNDNAISIGGPSDRAP